MYATYLIGHEIPFRTILFPAWFIYFYIGIYVRKYNKESINKNWIVFLFVGLISSIVEGYIIDYKMNLYGFACSQVKISSCIYSVAIINIILIINSKIKLSKNIISDIGDNSYGIYYCHVLFLNLCSSFLVKVGLGNIPLPVYQLIQLSITLIVSYVFVKIIKLILGTYSYLIGE